VVDTEKEGFFPSKTTLITFERIMTIYGEVYYLHFEKCLRLLLKACKLDDLAVMHSIKIAVAIDGAEMFSTRTHVSSGIKITDEQGLHPLTGKPLTIDEDERKENNSDNLYAKVLLLLFYSSLFFHLLI
jgi:hypothetical protein